MTMVYLLLTITLGALLSATLAFLVTGFMEGWLEKRQVWRLKYGPSEFSSNPAPAEDRDSCKGYIQTVLRNPQLDRDVRVRFVSGLACQNYKLLAEVLEEMVQKKEENEEILRFLTTPLVEMGIRPVIYTSLHKFFSYLNDRRLGSEEVEEASRLASKDISVFRRGNRQKRVFSFIVSLALIVILSPLMLAICVLLWWDTPGSIIRKGKRLGLNGHVFDKYIFRTFPLAADSIPNGDPFRLAEAYPARVAEDYKKASWVTRLLIDWNLWKLPELFNVLKGDMAFIGPKPISLHELPHFSAEGLYLQLGRRVAVRPGMIGRAQLQGYHELDFTWKRSGELDEDYLNHFPLQDKQIFIDFVRVHTWSLFRRRGWFLWHLSRYKALQS